MTVTNCEDLPDGWNVCYDLDIVQQFKSRGLCLWLGFNGKWNGPSGGGSWAGSWAIIDEYVIEGRVAVPVPVQPAIHVSAIQTADRLETLLNNVKGKINANIDG